MHLTGPSRSRTTSDVVEAWDSCELDVVGELTHLALHPHPGEAFATRALINLAVRCPSARTTEPAAGSGLPVGQWPGSGRPSHRCSPAGFERSHWGQWAHRHGQRGAGGSPESRSTVTDGGAGVVAGRLLVNRDPPVRAPQLASTSALSTLAKGNWRALGGQTFGP